MTTWVFRQSDDPRVRDQLYREAQQGRLRQGWSNSRQLSLELGKSKWLREYRRRKYNPKHKPEPTYRDLAKMLEVMPGDLLVVPKQPEDDRFFVARAIANSWGQQSPCYCFFKNKPVGNDFRSCLTIDPDSLRNFKKNDGRVPPLLRKALFGRGAWYRSKVQRIRRNDLNLVVQKLTDLPPAATANQNTPTQVRHPATDSNPLRPFLPLADSDYVQTIPGGKVVRSRSHQTLVNTAAMQLKSVGARLVRRGKIDLYVARPIQIIIEAKILRGNAAQAMREGIGQLFWYRFEHGLSSAELCLLFDRQPSDMELQFLETGAGVLVVWRIGRRFFGGPQTENRLRKIQWLNGLSARYPKG